MAAVNESQHALVADRAYNERVIACPCCGSDRHRIWVYGYDRLHAVSKDRFTFARCIQCGACFQSYRPSASAIGRYYPDNYVPHNSAKSAPKVRRPRWQSSFLSLANAIGGATRAKKNIKKIYEGVSSATVFLDFGCGSGSFLDFVRKRGAHTIGMDASPRALDQVRARGHDAIEITEPGWRQLTAMGVDFVRMNHVVEHLYDPNVTLRKIWAVLKDDGVVHIAVPNPIGISAKLFGSYWHGLDCPRHVVLYPPHTLVKLLEGQGFRGVKVIPEPAVKDFVRSLGYVLRALGIWRGKEIDSFMNRPFLNLVCAVPVWIGGLLSRPDRFHIVAHK